MTLIRPDHKMWPRQLSTPSQLMESLGQKTRLRIIKSPLCSKIVLQLVGSWAYLTAHVLNKSRVINIDTFNRELRRIEAQTERGCTTETEREQQDLSTNQRGPLLTLSNHISCIDDPILWASLLPFTYYSTRADSVRWSAAALEICFSRPWHSTFFALGKTFPVVRGVGLDQPGMDFAAGLLRHNQWLHLFPEGRVMRDDNHQVISNKERGYVFKWGVAKLILDYFKEDRNRTKTCDRCLRILPFYHLGLDEILPLGWPYIPRFGKQITIFIRPKVIEMTAQMLDEILASRKLARVEADINVLDRIKLTRYLEDEFEKLVEPATRLHQSR